MLAWPTRALIDISGARITIVARVADASEEIEFLVELFADMEVGFVLGNGQSVIIISKVKNFSKLV